MVGKERKLLLRGRRSSKRNSNEQKSIGRRPRDSFKTQTVISEGNETGQQCFGRTDEGKMEKSSKEEQENEMPKMACVSTCHGSRAALCVCRQADMNAVTHFSFL